jgi:outer membrane protein insertion porin family
MSYFIGRRFKSFFLAAFFSSLSLYVSAADVQYISFSGLSAVNKSELNKSVSDHIGAPFTPQLSDKIVKQLYSTGLVNEVTIPGSLDKGNLKVNVKEQPMIRWVNFHGNSKIPTKGIESVLKKLEIVVGQPYSPYKDDFFAKDMTNEYHKLGFEKAKVVITKKRADERVSLDIAITEGSIAKIHSVTFTGNEHFTQKELLKHIALSKKSLLSFLTGGGKYSPVGKQQSIKQLYEFYGDHGYLHVQVKSEVVPNKDKTVNVIFDIKPGARFKFGKLNMVVGDNNQNAKTEYDKFLEKNNVQEGQWFSRSAIINANTDFVNYFKNKGYAQASVSAKPGLNDSDHFTQSLNIKINVGHRIYVRRINFVGNDLTQDIAIRNRIVQMEGAVYSQKSIDESIRRLRGLYYLTNITVEHQLVAGHPNQVDLTYSMKENSSGQFGFQGGYSEVNKLFVGFQVFKNNFLGTGNRASFNIQKGKVASQLSLSYDQPVLNANQTSRSLSFNYIDTKPAKEGLSDYNMRDLGLGVTYGLPILFENNRVTFGASFDAIKISGYDKKQLSPSYVDFLERYPSPYKQIKLNVGWQRDVLDQPIFPTSGSSQGVNLTVGVPVGHDNSGQSDKFLSLGYYSLSYTGRWFIPLSKSGFVANPHLTLGYGGGLGSFKQMPFFNNFYGGGITSLPGFAPNSLGPKNPHDTTQALGGNVSIVGGVDLIFPNHISDNLRTSVFADFGNVFDTHHVAGVHYEDFKLKNMRASVGLMLGWNVPSLGTIKVSIAKGLNSWVNEADKKYDNKQTIGFTISRGF